MSYTFRKSAKITKWNYNNRPITLDKRNENQLTFTSSNYFDYTLEKYSLRAMSRVQKKLRQAFWSYLRENNLPEFFILVLDGKEQPSRPKAFIELQLTFQNNLSIEQNKAICEMMFDLMGKELELIK
jgi:hypothetical protein